MIRPKVVCPLERHEEAIREAKRSKELDPLGLILNSICALVYCYACQYQTGEAEYRKAIELDPNFAFAHWTFGGLCLVSMEKYEEGIAELEKSIAMAENVVLPRGLLGYAYAKVGRRDNALRVVEELDKLAAHRYVTPMAKAFTYAGLGDERLFDALEDAYQQRSPTLVWLRNFSMFADIATHPRFQDLSRRIYSPPRPSAAQVQI